MQRIDSCRPQIILEPSSEDVGDLLEGVGFPNAPTSQDIVIILDHRTIRPRCEVKCVMRTASWSSPDLQVVGHEMVSIETAVFGFDPRRPHYRKSGNTETKSTMITQVV